ncbi:restriction endonuclease subunit S [Methanosphaera cuniculi]|uniref:restriction endonuclease subunit S n=1 Tax=Methanosphaera cuniculi TaxID=1077256 RepID=UPI0026F06184|nr:restriction endonuclease subunit S [Methanosphaera cuniculi]
MEQKYSLYVDIKKYFIENIFSSIYDESNNDSLINDVKWKQLKLKDIIKKGKAGGTPKSSVKEYYDGNIPFLSINDMTKEGKYIISTEKTISELGLENSAAWLVPEKSLLYSMYASVGFVSINNIPLTTSQAIFSIIFKDDVDLEFMYYYLTFYKKYIHRYIETGTQQNLKAETIKNFKIKIPPLEKQEKISKLLSSIDKYIQIYEQDLNNLKKYKKGLLQKMFI